ncbi:gamma carbonic anhydrase family protein [Cohnella thailandensis]|uniref:Gamma carbonic anhydrase family protein n=1 Tax=Cohnella thailandensis TaxID=557557 RepID=A0A841SPX9_9BACL|nr:gamma carbonic anhydrase family protein [Cohnella thailandensis]MBB6634483.1 gamma carbonic anhydrase family protein [Cohnella thailandensis]MBP1972963.1 carbonic anhydrase/acetyltransferase-like protein (isoleucine patch superfamily) [Cohnella thailandensis]
MATIHPYKDKEPDIHETAYLAKGSVVTGDVRIGRETSIWYNSVIRGDVAPTIIGERVSIQDNSTLHQSPGNPLIIEDDVTVGHNAVLHSCTVRKGALVGMGAIVLDGAEIGEEAMIGAGALVPPGKKIPPRTLVVGSPAKPMRELNENDLADMRRIRREYVEKGQYYKRLES